MRLRVLLLTAAITNAATVAFPQGGPPTRFQFTANDFWLNLHHYLYVLGRAHNGAPDAKQPAVASAPDDEQRGLASLTDEERRTWQEAVSHVRKWPESANVVSPGPAGTHDQEPGEHGEGSTSPSSTWDWVARVIRSKNRRRRSIARDGGPAIGR